MLRLIVKAHKYIKRWRGPSGMYHYQYTREKEGRKVALEKPLFLCVDNKKMLVPPEHILATFNKFGATWVILPEFEHQNQKINPNVMQLIEVNAGLRATKLFTGSVSEATKLAKDKLNELGEKKVQRAVSTAKPAVELPDNSKDIRAYAEKSKNLDAISKLLLATKINRKLDDIFSDPAIIVKWMDDNFSESELPELWEKTLEDYDENMLEVAIRKDFDLEDAGNYVGGIFALFEIGRQHQLHMEIDEIEGWAEKVGFEDDLKRYGEGALEEVAFNDSVLGSIEYDEVIARAMEQGVSPDEINNRLESEAVRMRSEQEGDKASSDYGENSYTTGYEHGKAVFYDLHLTPEKAETALKSGSPTGGTVLGGGCNGSFRVQVEDGDPVEVVFKPYKGEAHHLREDIPDNFYIREAAAYELDKMLGIGLVPPTVVMDIDGDVGSAQYFVKAKNAILVYGWEARVPVDQMTKAALLDYLIYNEDRHGKNFMIDEKDNLILIDNGLSLPLREDYPVSTPFLSNLSTQHERVPQEIYERMENAMLKGDVEKKFSSMGLEKPAVDDLIFRWNKVLESGKVDGRL